MNEKILRCSDLFVLLTNNNGKYDYLESYRLGNILYYDEKFWGKFSNVHCAVGHPDIHSNEVLSYAYSNFSSVICTCGLASRVKRFFSNATYRTIEFKAKGRFKPIWFYNEGGEIVKIHEAVQAGCRLKAKIESHDGYTYILNLHTVEVDLTAGLFFAETEFDGYPEELRNPAQLDHLQTLFYQAQHQSGISHPSTNYTSRSDFFLTSFKIYQNRILHRFYDDNGVVKERVFDAKNVSIWQELSV